MILTTYQVNCSTHVSFAASQPSAEYLDSPPTGVVTSKQLYSASPTKLTSPLPDMVAQVRGFVAIESESISGHTIFALSFGFWDIYHMAGLDYELGQKMIDAAVDELVAQIDILYTHYTKDYSKHHKENAPPFQIIIPKVFDPSLVPGWLSRRAVPPSPSTIAEQQKQAVYLTQRWNSRLENALGAWVTADAEAEENAAPNESNTNENDSKTQLTRPRKDVFNYDLPRYILGLIVEHQLEDAGQRDASGLGAGQSPFTSVSEPCLREGSPDEKTHGVRNTVCNDPETYLFWDEFNLGAMASEGIGRAVASMVDQGVRMKR